MLTWKNSAAAKNAGFFGGGLVLLHTLSPTGMLSAANHTPPFWPYWGPVGPLLPPFGPGFSSAQHFHPKKNIEKFMPCDLKGVIHSTCFKFQCVQFWRWRTWNLDISWYSQMSTKKGALQTYQTLAHNLFELPCTQKGSRFKKLMLSKPPFPPFIIAAMADIIIAICHIQALKKKLCITWKMSPRNKKNPTERQNVVTYIFYRHSHPPCRTPFPFPSDILLKSLLEHLGCIAELWLHL